MTSLGIAWVGKRRVQHDGLIHSARSVVLMRFLHGCPKPVLSFVHGGVRREAPLLASPVGTNDSFVPPSVRRPEQSLNRVVHSRCLICLSNI